jgi:hypothetical protein
MQIQWMLNGAAGSLAEVALPTDTPLKPNHAWITNLASFFNPMMAKAMVLGRGQDT